MKNKILFITIIISILLVNICYAAINSITGEINGVAMATAQTGVFIKDVIVKENNNSTYKINSYLKTTLDSLINLNSSNSTLTLSITVYNNSTYNYKFDQVLFGKDWYDNDNIEFSLIGLNKNDLLESKTTKTFDIMFKFKNKYNITKKSLKSVLNFNFKKVYKITYNNFTNIKNYPKEVLEGENLNINFDNNVFDIKIKMNNIDLLSNEYTFKNNNLIIDNVTGDIMINHINWFIPIKNGNNYMIIDNLPKNASIGNETFIDNKYNLNISVQPKKGNVDTYNYQLQIKNTSNYDWNNIGTIDDITNPGGGSSKKSLRKLTSTISNKIIRPGEVLTLNIEIKYKLNLKCDASGKIILNATINGVKKNIEVYINYVGV